MKTFYSVEDIENFAEQGRREIYVDENIVLTDMAKQTAQMLGIRITEEAPSASPGDFISAQPQSSGNAHALRGNPKGCQRRPTEKPANTAGASTGQSRQVVDKLVETIKRINGQSG